VASKVKNAYQESGVSALGVDIERMGRVVPELWPQLMRDEELSRLQTLSARERDVSATLIFSAKEAFYKAQYSLTGTWVDFGDAAIELLIDSFVVHVKNTALPIAQHSRTFKGRYFVSAEQVVTALAI
jgi:4'-phosphopantetheinyl transferase EntD